MKPKRKEVKLKLMIMVHGKSERQFCQCITSNLRLKREFIDENKGKNSIQITGINKYLDKEIFKNFNRFIKKFDDIEYKKKKLCNFRFFIIMDTDDCTPEEKQKFISGEMFNNHWLSEYITPIYSIKNFEDTMKLIGIEIQDKGDYIKLFPINNGNVDMELVERFAKQLNGKEHVSNLYEFLIYCLKIAE